MNSNPTSRDSLLASAQTFCDAFAQKKDVDTILELFSSIHEISAIEHGKPILAPFIGHNFVGRSGVRKYFEIIQSCLSYDDIQFSEYVVDKDVMKVSVKGTGSFTWLKTGKTWDEIFTYTLDFDGDSKVMRYQVWADSGAAYLARIGELVSKDSPV